ncbi:hypothetical protein Prudu_017541, partial [Prunus dulcis]
GAERSSRKKVKVKCNEDDTIGDLKKLVAAQTGTRSDKIRIQKWYNVLRSYNNALAVGSAWVRSGCMYCKALGWCRLCNPETLLKRLDYYVYLSVNCIHLCNCIG